MRNDKEGPVRVDDTAPGFLSFHKKELDVLMCESTCFSYEIKSAPRRCWTWKHIVEKNCTSTK